MARLNTFKWHSIRSGEQKEEEVAQVPYDAVPGFTFGADPEVFIRDKNGRLVSAAGLIPGTKLEPYPVKHGAVQVDGMAAEFNIDPAANFTEFNRNITAVMSALEKMLPAGHTIDVSPSVVFDKDVFEAAPDDAKELGCTPDMNAWTGGLNAPPSAPDNPFMRCGGGHLHIGWIGDGDPLGIDDEQHVLNCRDLVRQFDWYLGAWSLRIDTDAVRRQLYGKAGAMRVKPYGVEYRTLSNFWITTRDRRCMVWNRMQAAIRDIKTSCMVDKFGEATHARLITAIDTSTKDAGLERDFRYPIATIEATFGRRI